MLELGLLGFANPWLLGALVALPALWLLLRITPPTPRRRFFPPLRLLLRLPKREETPARTPWWLLVLRLVIAALVILAMAGPILEPRPRLQGSGPILLALDDGWASAADWQARLEVMDGLMEQAAREEREIILLRTAPTSQPMATVRMAAAEARRQLAGLEPRPWAVDRDAARKALAAIGPGDATPFWLTDGIADSLVAREAAQAFARRLAEIGDLRVVAPELDTRARLLLPPELDDEGFKIMAIRPIAGEDERLTARAIGPEREILGTAALAFAGDAARAEGHFRIPLDLRNKVARVELVGRYGIGGMALLDERWRRRTVGLVGREHGGADQPLISELYFIERALLPFAELRRGDVVPLLAQPLSLLVMPDAGKLGEEERQKLLTWIEEGGVLLRFAGPKLAQGGDPDLLPVQLRGGDRQLGGALSWSEPLALAPFPADTVFAGLVPTPETRIRRQVLAEPNSKLGEATLAILTDGTPLVTGRRQGRGWLILVHTTANTSWTNLPLSGNFVELLRRVLALAPGVGGDSRGTLEAQLVLDATGTLTAAPPGIAPIAATEFRDLLAGPAHPPGLWAQAGLQSADRSERARFALNLQTAVHDLQALDRTNLGAAVEPSSGRRDKDLGPWLLLAALLLTLLDLLVSYGLRGLVPLPARAGAAALLLLLALPASAAEVDPRVISGANDTRLGYILTGDRELDELSRIGLTSLGRILAMRTSIETADPIGVDPAKDELAVYPLLYWPVTQNHPELLTSALRAIQGYLKGGGMLLIDTKDAGFLFPGQDGGGPGERRLGRLLAGIDLAPLIRVPAEHVLTRSFYLLQDFPGRFTGQPVWVDQASAALNDGVSSVIIGAHDWVGAWAEDDYGRTLLPVLPGGEQQREMAKRFGVNIVMYAMTGNYKTDQVHIPALLERLGQ